MADPLPQMKGLCLQFFCNNFDYGLNLPRPAVFYGVTDQVGKKLVYLEWECPLTPEVAGFQTDIFLFQCFCEFAFTSSNLFEIRGFKCSLDIAGLGIRKKSINQILHPGSGLNNPVKIIS